MRNRIEVTLSTRRLEIKYSVVAGCLTLLLVILSSKPFFSPIESDLIGVLEAAVGFGVIGLFAIAFFSNLMVIINIPFMLVALPWVVADPTLSGMVLFSLSTGIGAGLGKLIAYALAARVASRFESLNDSTLHRWISAQIARRPRFAPALVFIAAGTVLPLDPALMPLLLVDYPARKVAVPLLAGKVLQSFTMALLIVLMSSSLGVGGGMNVDLTLGVLLGTLLLVGYQIEKGRAPRPAVVLNS
ncbi:MAG: hypothetical protein JXA10_05445 [Anaerolineae bacterium]|nr:hypothetical protein [Anaerolineae bacterium]